MKKEYDQESHTSGQKAEQLARTGHSSVTSDLSVAAMPKLFHNSGNQQFEIELQDQDECGVTALEGAPIVQEEKSFASHENEYRNKFIFLNSILESTTNIIIFSLDTSYCYTAFTKFHRETIKQIWGVDIQVGMNMLDVISSPEDRTKARKNFDRALSGEYFIQEEEYGDAHLSRTFYEDYYSPLKDCNDNIIGLSVFVIDISDRRLSEQKILRLNTLYSIRSEISKAIVRVKKPEELFASICHITVECGKFKMAWVGLIDQVQELIIPQYFAGDEQGYLSDIRISNIDTEFGRGPTGTSVREGHCIICQNNETDPIMGPWRDKALGCGFHSSASVPFRQNKSIIGTVTVYCDKPYGFDPDSENLLNEIGNDISFALDAMDATKRRLEVEEELRDAYKRTESIIEASHIGTWEWNIQTGESVLNEQCAKIIGYLPGELVPLTIETIMDFADPEDLKRSAEILDRHFRGELPYYDCEGKIKHKDGHWVWVHDRGKVISRTSDGKPLLMFGTNIDITARKHAEEEIKESEEKYRSLFSTDKNGLLLFDKETLNILEVNDSACNLFGYSRDEILTLKIVELSAESEKSKQAISSQQNRIELRYYRKKNGTVFPVDISGGEFTLRNRQVVFASFRDITERETRNQEIELKNKELQRLNSEKDKFFSIISHDLRAPFNGFLGLTEMMAEGLSRMTLDEIQSLALMMKESASNLYSLLGNLLEWSQMQRGLFSFAPEPFNLLKKITDCTLNSLVAARKKGIDFHVNINTDLSACADVHMFESIMRNLCNNAVKFTPKGGKITITAQPDSNDSVEISIKDTGIGMDKKIIDKLFCLITKTNRKGTENEPSSGLGLILCKDFIQKHGSDLKVVSKVGRGATFSFSLPFS